ncbi:hypothetical protein AB1L88_18945 [Tautonia sp. JC769]|uniref:hypothetical protein n=1 Tax=Tautonia sp. JC769 TaxID=3232135 RepID=UPI003458B46A
MSTYQPPLDQLLRLGEVELGTEGPDYRAMGIGPEHVPELTRMATDADLFAQLDREDVDEAQAWACEHALKAIAQLRAVEAVGPLLADYARMIDVHDFWVEELAEVMETLGPGALPDLERSFEDPANEHRLRSGLCESFTKIALAHPESRERVVAFLTRMLAEHPETDETLNGFIVATLLDLEATEAAPAIEAAFEANRVDISIAGDWPIVRYELGLGPMPENLRFASGVSRPSFEVGPGGANRPDLKKLKAKKKQQKQARARSNKRKKR